MNRNLEVRAKLQDDEGRVVMEAVYVITEDFLDEAEATVPEGLYSWYPRYTSGDVPTAQKIEGLRKNFRPLFQDWLCNHAHAHMILRGLADGVKPPISFSFFVKDLEAVFSLKTAIPSEDDFMMRMNRLIRAGHEEFAKQIFAPHVAQFYNIRNKQAESFLSVLERKGLLKLNRRAGFQIPYGLRYTEDASAIQEITSQGLSYRPTPNATRMLVPKCFVIMPLSGLNHIYAIVVDAWKEVFGKDAEIFHQDDDPDKGAGELIDHKIQTNIRDSTIVVSILSMGTKERPVYEALGAVGSGPLDKCFPLNANVLIELGYALRCRQDESCDCKDVLILTERPHPFEFLKGLFDIRNRNFIPYEKGEDGETELRAELVRTLKHLKDRYSL